MTINLGIAPINWCNDDDPSLGKDISFEQCIDEMAQAGFVGTEIGNKYPRDPVVLKAALAARGLQVISAWFSSYFTEPDKYQTTLSDFLAHMSFLRALGAKYINICECGHAIQQTSHAVLGEHKPVFTAIQWEALIKGLHHIGRLAHDFGMTLVYHYHAGTGVFTREEIDFLMRHTSPTLLSLLLDTGHAQFAGIDSVDLIEQYGGRIQYVHFKDIRQPVWQRMKAEQWPFMDAVKKGVFTVPGDGDINFARIIAALKKQHYTGWILVEAEQDPQLAPPLAYAKKAYAYLDKLLQPVILKEEVAC